MTPSATPAPNTSASGFETLYPCTREPGALARLAGLGVPPPDETGVEIMIDGECVARAEWRWLERRVALLVPGTSPEALCQLQESGWRTARSTDEPELCMLANWLRDGTS